MSPREVALRVQKKCHQIADRRFTPPGDLSLDVTGQFPKLPSRNSAPAELLESLKAELPDLLNGQWMAFGHLPLTISDPPAWQADNLVGKDLRSNAIAFKLDHRAQPGGADIKVVWEPSRWYQLVRLALAAWLLDNARAQEKCIEWLHDWVSKNPPFTGLNWTSGLETGIRLIQYTWIDAFLAAAGVPNKTLIELRGRILPAHQWYTWRYKSFGSSANNHLIGELAGLIIAQSRWPELQRLSAPLPEMATLLDREILAQFAADGGNQEQALGYHLFSWEFCFQAERALRQAAIRLSPAASERLVEAGNFYRAVKAAEDPWDFGDSDNAWVTPLFVREGDAAREWWRWFDNSGSSPALRFWWGDFPGRTAPQNGWKVFKHSGYAVLRTDDWFVRFDFSPLGYLTMAPHGHLDALHLSVSFRGQPIMIDPGTGAYYADRALRNYLADWSAHNGPQLKNPPQNFPQRFGTFLWGEHHRLPQLGVDSPQSVRAELDLPYGKAARTVAFLPEKNALSVRDEFLHSGMRGPVITRWKIAPEFKVERLAPNQFQVGTIKLETSAAWKMARTYNPPDDLRGKIASSSTSLSSAPLESLVAPAFRAVTMASYLALESDGEGPLELVISPG